MELEDLYTLLKAAAQTNVALTKCSSAVARLLGLMLAIQITAQANKVPPSLLEISDCTWSTAEPTRSPRTSAVAAS